MFYDCKYFFISKIKPSAIPNGYADQKISIFRHISPEKFYIEPKDANCIGEKVLEIDRVSQELSLAGKNTTIGQWPCRSVRVFAAMVF